MEFKGTKNNWRKTTEGVIFNNEDLAIAIICFHDIKEQEQKANALLISKAPEMLEMLKKIYFGNDYKNPKLHMEIKQLIKEATEL